MPVPYYIPKPVYKYILRHHYVPVRHVVVKPVPVPVPIKVKEHKSYKKSSSYKGEGSSGYETVGYHQGSDSGYDSGMDENSYSGSNVYGKYAAMPHGHTNSGYHSGNYFGLPSSSKSPPHTSGDSANTASPYASSVTLTAGNPKESASENYLFDSTANKQLLLSDEYGSKGSMGSASSPVAAGSPTGGGYQIAPVYQGPNGQLYSNGQLVSKDYFNSNGVQTAFPSATSKSSMSGVPYGSKIPLLTPGGQQSQMNRASLRTNMAKGVLNDYGAQIEEAKKYLTGLTKREDPSGLDSGESNSSSAPSSSSEEDSRESKGAGRM